MCGTMPKMPRKRPDRYHHGDLSRSLLQEALRTIEKGGVAALTLRSVGEKLGVSRTALYRHFADKSALLAAVATEGFRTLRHETQHAWDAQGGGRKGFEAMGEAYVRFAVAHPSHYRVMFGGYVRNAAPDSDLASEGAGAFQVLVDAIVSQQRDGLVRADNPLELAQYIWANVHGIAMLAIDGQLKQPIDDVIRFANERMRTGIESTGPRRRVERRRVESRKSKVESPKSRVQEPRWRVAESRIVESAPASAETRTGLEPWVLADLPEAPAPIGLQWAKVVGPGVIVLGLSLGGGEFLLGPTAFVRYGMSLLWITLVAVFFQTIFNTELMRYTVATGEPVFTGFMRTRPARAFWAWLYVAMYLLQVGWPYSAGLSAGAIFFLATRRIATPADATLIYQLGVGTFLLCILLLMLGRRIERTLELLNWVMVVCILGGFLLLGLYFVPGSTWAAAARRILRIRSAAPDVQLHAG